jgi:hypothetical protein
MTKKNIFILLLPCMIFITITALTFHCSSVFHKLSQAHSVGKSDQAYDKLVKKVQSGELLVTSDMMIDQLRRLQHNNEVEDEFFARTAENMRTLGWIMFGGIVLQVYVILRINMQRRN